MFIDTVAYRNYLASGGSPAICAAAATISCIKEPEYIHFSPQQITLHYRHTQDSLALTLASSAARVTCHVTLNSYGLDIFSLPDDFESLYDLMHKHVDIKNTALAYNIASSRRDQKDPGLIFGRMYACMGALYTQFVNRDLIGDSLQLVALLDAFILESCSYELTEDEWPQLCIFHGGAYVITFCGIDMLLTLNGDSIVHTASPITILSTLERRGLSVLPYSDSTSVKNTEPPLQPSDATTYFSSTIASPQNQGHPYAIRITETYTREVVLYATTTQELGAKALELTKNHPETFGDGFNKAGVTIKRLS